jgi:hypothetical protein
VAYLSWCIMFLSLPHSLLALIVCLLDVQALADSPSPSPTAHFGNIGDYVASGLGISNWSTSQENAPAPTLATTGTGQEYASKCAAALATWSRSSLNWQWNNAIISTSTFSSGFTETLEGPGSTKVTSIVTLCDGHPRVVGHTSVSRGEKYTSTVAWTNTITGTNANHAYPTSQPCSIQPSDCKTLSRSYENSLSALLDKNGFATIQGPMCTITPSSSYSYSTASGGQTCDNCMIAASTARVMFWPITTAPGADLCNKTGSTITASPTGPPNSFVTEGITITSPSVAVSLGYMSRVDGCGTTIAHTIIPVHPDQVSSVRGFRALFSHHQFNFADLNYFCMNTNTTMATIPEGEGDSCYQQVPAAAYFGGLNNAVVLDQAPFRNLSKAQMTIFDDYQPQLLPPRTMTEAITSIWGNDCIIHPDGVWDPPIALTPEASLVVPTYPGGGAATTESSDAESTPASPINSYGAVPPRQTGIKKPTQPDTGDSTSERQHFTALPEVTSGSSSGGYGGQRSGSGDSGSSSGQQNSGSGFGDSGSSSGQQGSGSGFGDSESSLDQQSSGSSVDAGSTSSGSNGSNGQGDQSSNLGSGSNGGSNVDSGSNDGNGQSGAGQSNSGATRINVHTTIITVGSKILQCTQDYNGAWVIPDASTTRTASVGGPVVEIDAAKLTASPNGLVNVNSHNSVLTIGNKVITCTQAANGAWMIPEVSTTHTLSQGGSAVQIDGVTLTAASQGLVRAYASGGADGLVNANSVVTIGTSVITGSQDANGAWVIPEASATHKISQGGSAFVMNGVTVTAASQGLVNAHASGSTNSVVTVGNRVITASQDYNGAWIIPDASTTYTISQSGPAVTVNGAIITAASQGILNTNASAAGGSTEASGTGIQSSGATQSNRAQSTSGTNTDSSAAGATRWSPVLCSVVALLTICLCAL